MSALDTRALQQMELEDQRAPAVDHDFRVIIAEDAFDRMVARGGEDTAREIGGILVGQVLRDECGAYVVVDTTIDALHAEEKGAELTITHATWAHVHDQMDTVHKGKKIVGWYHTHPGFGIFLSDRDLFIQQSFFNLPFQVALVYDPKSREHGLFTWRDNKPWRTRRYWVGDHGHVWDGVREEGFPSEKAARKTSAPSESKPEPASGGGDGGETAASGPPSVDGRPARDDETIPSTWLIVGGLVCALLAGVLGWQYGRSSLRDEVKDELHKVQGVAMREAVQSLHSSLLDLMGKTIGDAAQNQLASATKGLDEAIAELDAAASDNKAVAAATLKIKTARAMVARLRLQQQAGEKALLRLERDAREGPLEALPVMKALQAQQQTLAMLHLDLAREVARHDKTRAVALLSRAAKLDPTNREAYAEAARQIDPGGGGREPPSEGPGE